MAARLGRGRRGGVGLIVLRGQVSFDLLGVLAGHRGRRVDGTRDRADQTLGTSGGRRRSDPRGWQLTAGGLVLVPFALAFEGLPPDRTSCDRRLRVAGCRRRPLVVPDVVPRDRQAARVAVSFLALLSPVVATTLGWLFLVNP